MYTTGAVLEMALRRLDPALQVEEQQHRRWPGLKAKSVEPTALSSSSWLDAPCKFMRRVSINLNR
ncbi:hypothetical protein PGT21_029102 [Puccinia graminis f. sp. tritici]|uniref:Uncharacterized protein n=1 Tax=Puccinia graminis f. sp. tritici TaxID=56615 RepID=A0A5B0RSQ8_PUCGR|nr:hypothetical protein PGT21_029102 [Puccinia graminis f. sp. tritici]KAA1128318.1 hypothetical protein PGTUg99_006744 [Puccinia graminis f. sp. tritici]